jgi:hypothetical protein
VEHRAILEDWLAKGDLGAGQEPDEELQRNGENTHWGIGVNPEYERIRSDSDGDGLSDTWEEQNERDPADGKLLFTFDCGGWQNEGWRAEGDTTNLAGYQGYLDFDLLSGRATLVREGLKLDVAKNQGNLVLRMRVSSDTKVTASANGKRLGEVEVAAGTEYVEYRLPLRQPAWRGTIESLKLEFASDKGTTVGIDWIRVREEQPQ